MLLTIDIGNTNIVFGLFDGDVLKDKARIATSDLASFQCDWQMIDSIIVSSVVPDVNPAIEEFCKTELNAAPYFITHKDVPIAKDIEKPQQIGADRLVNAAAVNAYYKSPAIVIDFGTATTFDVIDSSGAYSGGVIAPGVNLSLEVLSKAAAKLPHIDVKKPFHAIGVDTLSAMQSGAYFGYLGLIEKIVDEIRVEYGEEMFVIATGGLAPLFAKDNPYIHKIDDDLTLKGLYVLALR